ncbi:MAG: glycosyltransferase family 4 protein, partial [Candidatus Micrarchaeota archaeon]
DNKAISSADAVAVISPQLESYALSHGAKKTLLYFPPTDFKPVKKTRGKKFVFGYIGSTDPWQGIDMLFKAFQDLNDSCELRVYGRMTPALEAKAGEDYRIKLFGEIPNSEVPSALASFDVFVLPRPSSPTVETTTPIKLVEAMRAGCAVLSTDVGGASWLLKDGENALVCRPTVKSLRRKMQYALKHRRGLTRLGKNARETAGASDYRRVGKTMADFMKRV